jgi:succinate-semialdehyde dehydrogenase / glutarate-semialdehyde dehydrogenase
MTTTSHVDPARVADYRAPALVIDGEWIDAVAAKTSPVVSPASWEVLATVPHATEEDVERAARAAAREFASWRRSDPAARAALLVAAAQALRLDAEAVAREMSAENGKPLAEARGEVEFSARVLEFFAGEATRTQEVVTRSGALSNAVRHDPVGPVAAFTTWNYPLTVPARKLGAAIAAGCTVVLKADRSTPASATALVRAFVVAGAPAGVVNLLFGDSSMISDRLIAHDGIRKVSFTGSARVGRIIATAAGAVAKPLMLELGGHAPVLIFDDVDIDAVAAESVGAKFHNAGQSCGSPTRFFVHRRVHDRFVEAFAAAAAELRVADPLDETTQMGPLANHGRVASIAELMEDAVAAGATKVLGGPLEGDGNFWSPSLLSDVPLEARAMQHEPFGPLALTHPFDDVDQAIALANSLPYGLAAYVFSDRASVLARVEDELEVGMLGVGYFGVGDESTYFGGVKESGYGAEGGMEAVRGYQVPRLISRRVAKGVSA